MASPNDVPPPSLFHCEEPLAAIMTKSCRETHCHFCFNKVQTDVCFCPLCTIPIYCSQYCQELAGGKPLLRNMDVDKMWNEFSDDIEKHVRNTIADSYSKYPVTNLNTEHIPEHKHERGGANWSAVLPPHVVLAGRVMMRSIEKRKASGELSKPMETLDLAHNYLEIPSEGKLELHIFARVLSYCFQCYASDFPVSGDSASKGYPWSSVFAARLWSLWKSRCAAVFNSNNQSSEDSTPSLNNYNWHDALRLDSSNSCSMSPMPTNYVVWNKPPEGVLKFNLDAGKSQNDQATIGGVLRDLNGHWILGFKQRLCSMHILQAELQRMQAPVLSIPSSEIKHVSRSANSAAHALAQLAKTGDPSLHVLYHPPDVLYNILAAEAALL